MQAEIHYDIKQQKLSLCCNLALMVSNVTPGPRLKAVYNLEEMRTE